MITTESHVYFYSGKEIYSNWHRTQNQFRDPITGLIFQTSEAHFMWSKADFFKDLSVRDTINSHISGSMDDPAQVKNMGRRIQGYNDKAWEAVRTGFMVYACYLKFSQNPEWAKQLKDTGDRILVEASPVDRIWGIGITVEQAAAGQPWDGRNLLGKTLTKVRKML